MQSPLIHMGEKHIPRTTCTQLVCNRHTLLNSKAISSSSYGLLQQWCQNYLPQDKKRNFCVFFYFPFFFLPPSILYLSCVCFFLTCLLAQGCMHEVQDGLGIQASEFCPNDILKALQTTWSTTTSKLQTDEQSIL